MATTLLAGLAVGAIYALIALGYNITIISAGVVNFAQANFIVLGMFITSWGYEHRYPVVVTLVVAVGVGAIAGIIEERLAIRPLKAQGAHGELVTTVGASTVITGIMLYEWGSDPRRVPFFVSNDPKKIFGGTILPVEIALVIAAIVIGAGMHAWGRYTRAGLASLAQSEDREAATLRGINVHRFSMFSFAFAGGFGAALGLLVGPKTYALATLGGLFAVKGFVVLALAGMGSQGGAVVGGFAVGILEALAGRWWGPAYRNLAVYTVFLSVLMVRPTGIFGDRRERVV